MQTYFALGALGVMSFMTAQTFNIVIADWLFVEPDVEPAAKPTVAGSDRRAPLSAFLERNLFGGAREGAIQTRAPRDECEEIATGLRLVATFVSDDPSASRAIFVDATDTIVGRVDRPLPEVGTVVQIGRREVELRHEGHCRMMSIAKMGGVSAAPSAIAVTVDRAELETAMSNLHDLGRQARIVPHFEDGQPAGFALHAVQPRSIYARHGLRSQDVIKRIGGRAPDDSRTFITVRTALLEGRDVAVDLVRNGQPQTIVFRLR